jgi:hypothetical protein
MSSFYNKAILDPHDRRVASDRLREKLARRKLAELTTSHGQNAPMEATPAPRKVTDEEAAAMAMDAIRIILEKQQLAEYDQRTANATNHAMVVNQQRETYKLLNKSAMYERNESKANPATFTHKIKEADNAAKRAIVHHTGSHYHMAGGVQFQRGVRVKGTISRHSVQGMKMQAARVSRRNMLAAREAAKGERAAGKHVAAKNMMTAREDAKGQRSEGPRSSGKQKGGKKSAK